MAFSINAKNQSLSKQTSINPQAILVVEGLDIVFGSQPVLELLRWDASGVTWDSGERWDSSIERPDSRSVISLESGTTNSITQQIFPDKESSGSISTVNISMVDLNNEVARLFSFDNITEILGKKADFYIGFKQGNFPEDSIPIFRGVIVDFYTQNGMVMVSVAHPEKLKDQILFQKYLAQNSNSLDDIQTTIQVNRTEGLFESQDTLTSYVKIEDELMQLISIDSDTQITVTRGQLTSIAASHDSDNDIESYYVLEGSPIPLALKLMLSSDGNEFFTSDDKPVSINFIDGIQFVQNALIFESFNIEEVSGLVVGDIVTLNSIDNTGTYTIQSFGTTDTGSYIVVNENLVTEVEYANDFTYKSQYNVLPDGLGMLPSQVDVEGHENILSFFPSNFTDYKIYIKDTIEDPREFISKEIYFPQGLYTIPRKARASCKIITPPFSSEILPTLNTKNITNLGKLQQRRSLHKYLYNIYRYDFEEDELEDKFKRKEVLINNDSLERIKGGKKELKIQAKGLRDNPPTILALEQILQRMKDRYSFAPTYINGIKIKYSDGFNIEVGDVLPFGGIDTKLVDLQTGKRNQTEKLYEVINKSLNIKTGEIKIDILETSFSLNSRNGVFSLASQVNTTSTTTRIEIKKSYDTGEFLIESDKWKDFEGQNIRVRSEDYTFDETVVFDKVDPSDNNFLLLKNSTPLSVAPLENYLVEIPEYNDTSAEIDSTYKIQFAHMTAQVNITNVTSESVFEVDRPQDLVVDSEVYVHSDDYTRDSFNEVTKIDSIVGNVVTLGKPLSFLPLINDKVEASKFNDLGNPYSII